MKVKSLAYIGIDTKVMDEWQNFGTRILGMMVSSSSTQDCLKFKLDDRSFRIAIHKGKEEKFKYAGFELENKAAFEQAQKELSQLKINFKIAKSDECTFRDVKEMVKLHDPIGTEIELFYGRTLDYQRFVSPVGVSSFITGEMGLGHIVLPALQVKENYEFYTKVLGFKETDFMSFTMGEGDKSFEADLHFLHCENPRHHTVGLFESPHPNGLVHLMLEVPNIDEVGYALDRVNQAGVPLQSTLGRHTNDKMVSFYMISPSGFAIEYGYDGWQVDWVDFTPTVSHSPSIWGHEFQQS